MSIIDLTGEWTLKSQDGGISVPMEVPGDVFSALQNAGVIEDPYWGENELKVQWVNREDWILEREFEVSLNGDYGLAEFFADSIDTLGSVEVNGVFVGKNENMFIPVRMGFADMMREGINVIRIYLESPEIRAQKLAGESEYPVPATVAGVPFSPHRNFVRKAQCHSGWDWGPCLMCAGVYGKIGIDCSDTRIEDMYYEVVKMRDWWEIRVTLALMSSVDGKRELRSWFAGDSVTKEVDVFVGIRTEKVVVRVDDPILWWPNGEGEQPLYPLVVSLGEHEVHGSVGFRTVELVSEDDGFGRSFKFVVNGREVFIKGANWVPCDSLPSRQSNRRIFELLEMAAEAHMNMVRVWGGGQYECDYFYDACDMLGLLVWQDFMFSCALYPADSEFLDSVELEIRYQITRLMCHASVALFCGNNENFGALDWYEESKNNRDVYAADYKALNDDLIGKTVRKLAPGIAWWPTSPCGGEGDSSDCWHEDGRGDMHFWSVWHENKPFEAFYDVVPRFCSEFGFQSFPDYNTVCAFANPNMRNVSSPVMVHHQKSSGGTEKILAMMSRYFRFPETFREQIYVSQVQQVWAIKMAVEYWRGHRPRCMGILYWQFNDTWPGISWSSIDYFGNQKLVQYCARRFYKPLHIAGWVKDDEITACMINDTDRDIEGTAFLIFRDFRGRIIREIECSVCVGAGSSVQFHREPVGSEEERRSTWVELKFVGGGEITDNFLFLHSPRMCNLQRAHVKVESGRMGKGNFVEVSSDLPAFYVQLQGGNGDEFGDNGFLVMPGRSVIVEHAPVDGGDISVDVMHLGQNY